MKREKLTEVVTFRVTPSEADQIRYLAALDKRTESDWVRLRLEEILDAIELDKAIYA